MSKQRWTRAAALAALALLGAGAAAAQTWEYKS